MNVRTIFMGTPQFAATVLESLLRSQCQVLAVYTQPDRPAGRGHGVSSSPVKRLALERGIPVVQPQSLKSSEAVEELARFGPDLIIVAASAFILPAGVLGLPGYGCLNIHPSLLPRHRGAAPIASAILCGDDTTGVTVMQMDSGMDTGLIVAQETVTVSPDDSTGSLSSRLAEVGAGLILKTLPEWLAGRLKPREQDESQATYSSVITAADAEMNWQLPALDLWRMVRAYNPWPGSHSRWGTRRLKVHEAVHLDCAATGRTGEVIALAEPPGVGVITGCGVLGLRQVQLEGKQRMSAGEFVLGRKDFIGSVLG
ncbi:MAG: methionyl-tRNA formyltransferase [Dehalococcoidia bacterium]